MRRALYAGSFDPTTNGHMWVVQQGARLFDELIVIVGQNPHKKGAWTIAERVAILKECCAQLRNVEVRHFDGRYLVRVAAELGARYLLRGLRNAGDFAYEQTIANVNRDLEPQVETVFLVTPRELAEVSSSTVRAMVGFAGWQDVVARYVPSAVLQRMKAEAP
ncbi:pantetheine-phosphate adenylyltransferase [Haliangium sp. UPWRP_2]|uniref:pantetheine-phosphate adenylyltransferase n=1 Tax=Haliangium sp. UPWRP_2 TaxID=1931276 RepID=UPI000B541C0B|nr:pantetheine-phosphate adenylyltransferase [Haliangium sp. UPWRP_2]PSM30937.1 pantetheine-phosphate adenylyltransferase [Haliangium sp. UPWRP_2]